MLSGKETHILEEVMSTLLSNEIRKRPNQEEQTGSGLEITEKKGKREAKKGPSSSKVCHFCHKEGHWKNDYKHWQEWVKKKGQTAEACIALSSLKETEILMFSNEDDTSQGKSWIFDSGSMVHIPKRSYSTP